MPRARTEEVAPSRYQYEKIRLPPAILSERDVACNQIAIIINEKPRQLLYGFSATQRQSHKYPARPLSTPMLPRWITWIVARQPPAIGWCMSAFIRSSNKSVHWRAGNRGGQTNWVGNFHSLTLSVFRVVNC
jgi:hypothetical protein